MRTKITPSCLLLILVLGGTCYCLFPGRAAGSEIVAKHLVHEKSVKMRKVDVSIFLPYFDQTKKADTLRRARHLECAVAAEGKAGTLRVRGRFLMRLLGAATGTSASWQSRSIAVPVDEGGEARFEPDDILELVDKAINDRVEVDLFEIAFDGGRGKKVTRLTIDCLHQEVTR